MKPQASTKKSVIPYILLWLFFVYLYVQLLRFNQGNVTDVFIGGMYFIEFGIHEASHIIFGFLPPIAVTAAGSFGEVTFAALLVFASFRAKAYFAAVFALLWLMLAMTSMGNYMADAQAQLMPLIGPGPDPQHDWHYVFGELGWLNASVAIGTTVRIAGQIIGTGALVYGLFLIADKVRSRSSRRSPND